MDHLLAYLLLVLGTVVCVASIDDIIVDILAASRLGAQRLGRLTDDDLDKEKDSIPNTAIFVANWHESEVLGTMVEKNLENFHCDKVQFVLGVYPNDTETLIVARQLERNHPKQVRVIVNRRDGPTSKGQMLNEIFNQVFSDPDDAPDLVIMHDSEDVIDPRSFVVYARESRHHAMIQIPIFSIDSRHRSHVGSTYMEEFAERHTKELPLRGNLGAFVPSAGVGTCLRKDLILHFIAERGHVLQPGNVTEDYILGAEAHQAGFSTRFAAYQHVSDRGAEFIATREFFPKDFWPSIRQRTRWTYGICFEGFRRLGWFGNLANRFFLYRDRKGIIANILPFLSLALLTAVLIVPPDFSQMGNWELAFLSIILAFNTICILVRIAYKCIALREVYGDWDLFGIILRWPLALTINAFAVLRAWRTLIVESGMASRPVAWAKTAHELPTDFASVSVSRAISVVRDHGSERSFARQHRGVAFASIAILCSFLISPFQLRDENELLRSQSGNIIGETAALSDSGRSGDAGLVALYRSKAAQLNGNGDQIHVVATHNQSGLPSALFLAEAGTSSLSQDEREFLDSLVDPYVVEFAEVQRRQARDAEKDRQPKVDFVVDARIHATAHVLAEISLQSIDQDDQEFLTRIASEAHRLPIVSFDQRPMPVTGTNSAALVSENTEHMARGRVNSSLFQISERNKLFASQLEQPEIVSPERLRRVFSERESDFDNDTQLAAFLFDYSLRTEGLSAHVQAAAALASAEETDVAYLNAVQAGNVEVLDVSALAPKLSSTGKISIQKLIELSADASRKLAQETIFKIQNDQTRFSDAVERTENASFEVPDETKSPLPIGANSSLGSKQ